MTLGRVSATLTGAPGASLVRRYWYPALHVLVAIGILVPIYWLAVQFVLARGLSAADDSFFAIIAKELAQEGHYGLPLSSETFRVFDPNIGSGPALILPAALLLSLAGTHLWVPGMTIVLLSLLQGALAIRALGAPAGNALLFYAGTLLLITLVGHFQWYLPIFVGELPAFGFTLIGACLLGTGSLAVRRAMLAGLSFGLAFLTKQIALTAIAGIVVVWVVLALRDRQGYRALARSALALCAMLTAPVAAFELIKLLVLGFNGYAAYLVAVAALTESMAVGSLPLSARLETFVDVLASTYQVHTGVLVCLGLALVLAMSRRGATPGARLTLMLAGGTLGALAYVLLVSILWPRYFYIGVALGASAIAAPLLDRSRVIVIGWLLVLVTAIATPAAVSVTWTLWREGPAVATELAAVQRELQRHAGLTIVSRWWGTFYDVAFQLPEARRWVLLSESGTLPAQPFLFVNNEAFAPKDEPEYQRLRSTCLLLMSTERYRVQRCEPAALAPPGSGR